MSIRPQPPIAQLEDCDEVEIKGESHYQDALIKLFGSYSQDGVSECCSANLVAEPSNKYDKNAVRCEIGGLLVGYVSKDEAEDVAAYLRRQGQSSMVVNANVKGGWNRSRSDQGAYGVTVELHPTVLDPDA